MSTMAQLLGHWPPENIQNGGPFLKHRPALAPHDLVRSNSPSAPMETQWILQWTWKYNIDQHSTTAWWWRYTNPSEKYDFVSWDDEIHWMETQNSCSEPPTMKLHFKISRYIQTVQQQHVNHPVSIFFQVPSGVIRHMAGRKLDHRYVGDFPS